MKSIGILAAALLLGSVGLASAQTVTNPDFSGASNPVGFNGFNGWTVTGYSPPGGSYPLTSALLDVYGNNLLSSNPGYANGPVPFTTFADFNNPNIGLTVTQKINGLVVGDLYEIFFWVATPGAASGGVNTFSASFGSANPDVLSNINNQSYFTEYSFYSTDTNGNLKFSISTNGIDIALSDVSVVLVPEPMSLTLLGLGVVGLGLARRRRRA